jgi:hypothetical protein
VDVLPQKVLLVDADSVLPRLELNHKLLAKMQRERGYTRFGQPERSQLASLSDAATMMAQGVTILSICFHWSWKRRQMGFWLNGGKCIVSTRAPTYLCIDASPVMLQPMALSGLWDRRRSWAILYPAPGEINEITFRISPYPGAGYNGVWLPKLTKVVTLEELSTRNETRST